MNTPDSPSSAPQLPPRRRREQPNRYQALLGKWSLVKGFLSKETILLILVVATIAVGIFTRGFGAATAQGQRSALAQAKWGEEITTGPFKLKVLSVETGGECLLASSQFPHCLTATVEYTNEDKRFVEDPIFATHLLDSGLVRLAAGEDADQQAPVMAKNPQLEDANTGLPPGAPQPGISETVKLKWTVGGDDPCALSLVVYGAKWMLSPMDLHEHWVKTEPVKRVKVCE